MMRILKFGGKSLATLEKTQNICKNIKKIYKNDKKLIIIVSAIGNETNELIDLVKDFHPEKTSKRELDALLATGENKSASIFAIILNSIGVPAKSFQGWQIKINTMGDFQNSLITNINKTKLNECLDNNIVAVVAGFQGVNKDGDITTLGRGGSDTTAAALGATFNTNVELYSDFNGLFSVDPREKISKQLKSISLNHLDKITSLGAKIVSNRAVKIAKENNFSITLKSSSEPQKKGTIVSSLEHENLSIVIKNNLCEICITTQSEEKLKFYSKNVLLWLKKYKIYNFSLKNQIITLLINQADKQEILNILTKKLNI